MKNLRFWKDITLGVAVFSLAACSTQKEEPLQPLDDVMMQAFYWDVPVDDQAKNGTWWDHLSSLAPELKAAGINSLWTPIPAKGNWGIYDSGYGIYDHYDLGNYEQKGTIETRYGSRAELEQMIATMHQAGIKVYSDVVLNHLYGGDENFEANPAVTAYVRAGLHEPYPESDIQWKNDTAYTRTHLFFQKHTGAGEPNYEWHYQHFHPSSATDSLTDFTDDVLRPRTKFFGNDLDTYNEEVQQRLCDWGKWLKGTIGFDGFRLDFVRGLQPEFVSRWVNGLPLHDGKQPFIVGEYWAEDGRYIKEWVDSVAKGGADVHAFDFPLKFVLTEMCNKSGDEFDMSRLAHAGMIRGFGLPVDNVVTFVDNHDTGKEHDKWLVKDYALAYAYCHPARRGEPIARSHGTIRLATGHPTVNRHSPPVSWRHIVCTDRIRQTPLRRPSSGKRPEGRCHHRAQQPRHRHPQHHPQCQSRRLYGLVRPNAD